MSLPLSTGDMVESGSEKVKLSTNGHQFFFRQRFGSFEWCKLAVLSLDNIIKGVNLEALQTILDDVTFSKFQEFDFHVEPNLICKLVMVFQLIVEYQLHCQEETEMVMHTLIQRAKEYHKALEQVKCDLANEKRDCHSLRRSNKRAEKVILAFKRMLLQHGMVVNENDFKELATSPTSISPLQLPKGFPDRVELNSQTEVRASANKCKRCGKVFSGDHFLQNHIKRRHGVVENVTDVMDTKNGNDSRDAKKEATSSEEKRTKRDEEAVEEEKAAMRLVDLAFKAKLEQERKKHEMELNHLSADVEELKRKEREKHDLLEFTRLRSDIEDLRKKVVVVASSPPTQAVNHQMSNLPHRNTGNAHSRVQRMLSLRKVLRIVRSSWNLNRDSILLAFVKWREASHKLLSPPPQKRHSSDVDVKTAPKVTSRSIEKTTLWTPQEMVHHAKRRSEMAVEARFGSTELMTLGGSGDISSCSNSVKLGSGRVLPSNYLLNPAEVEAERKSCLAELNTKAGTLGLDVESMKRMSGDTFASKLAEVAETRNTTLSEGVQLELSRLEGEITELEKQYSGNGDIPHTQQPSQQLRK